VGLSESQAYASVRFSVSVLNSNEDLDQTVGILADLVARLRKFSKLSNIID